MKKSHYSIGPSRGIGLACLAACAFLVAGAAQAQSKAKADDAAFYGEIGYSALTYKEPVAKAHPKAVRLLGGYELNPNLGVEAHVLLGAKDGSTTVEGYDVKVKVDSAWGIFLKPKMEVMPGLELFGRLGFAHARLTATATSPTVSASLSDKGNSVAYGLGAAYAINDKVSISLDYMSYYDRDDIRIKGPTLGLGIKF